MVLEGIQVAGRPSKAAEVALIEKLTPLEPISICCIRERFRAW
jgi:hypothetical protein